jgi:hypothetical protein
MAIRRDSQLRKPHAVRPPPPINTRKSSACKLDPTRCSHELLEMHEPSHAHCDLVQLSKNRRASGNTQLAKELLRTTSKVLLRATQ